jgi:hypothetical protein
MGNTAETTVAAQLEQIHAQLRLLTACVQGSGKGQGDVSPWLPLDVAAEKLHYKNPRALKGRIRSGAFPPDCYRVIPAPSGKKYNTYLVNVDAYIRTLGG